MADFFGKDHKHVLAKIDEIIARAPMDRQPNFRLTLIREVVGATERTLRTFDLTRDGFSFLVMGFTGPQADDFKWAYIARFNEMEEALRNPAPALPDFSNPAIAARSLARMPPKFSWASITVSAPLPSSPKVTKLTVPWAD